MFASAELALKLDPILLLCFQVEWDIQAINIIQIPSPDQDLFALLCEALSDFSSYLLIIILNF